MNLNVVGGTYVEICQFPEWDEVYGSGLRAAEVASSLGCAVKFTTCVAEEQRPALDARSVSLKIEPSSTPISNTVSFAYTHGFSTPEIFPPTEWLALNKNLLQIKGDNILQFGMLESDVAVHGGRVVYDPQNPHKPEAFDAHGSTAEVLAIVCNSVEARAMTGEASILEAVQKLRSSNNCAVVVVKRGSLGALVADSEGNHEIPAYETESVWPIGSGDVFAAAFAVKWAVEGLGAKEAASFASKATAFYCEHRHLQFPSGFPDEFLNKPLFSGVKSQKRVYLAGPFFSMSQIWLINEARLALRSQGLRVFSPLHDVGRGSAEDVYGPDIQGLRDCDVVFACVDGLDAGTLFEIGFAKAIEKPIVAFVQNEKPEDLKMLQGAGCLLQKDFVTAIYKTSWMTIQKP